MSIVRGAACVVLLGFVAGTPAKADKVTFATSSGAWTYYTSPGDQGQFRAALLNLNRVAPVNMPTNRQNHGEFGATSNPVTTSHSGSVSPAPPAAATTRSCRRWQRPAPHDSRGHGHDDLRGQPHSDGDGRGGDHGPGQRGDQFLRDVLDEPARCEPVDRGHAPPWYASPAVIKAFGGAEPNTAQQSGFMNLVQSDVQQTFALAGLHPTLTLSGATGAANHTISVTSGLSYSAIPNAIGITTVGNNGFSFIDKLGYATNQQDLAWAVAHNVAHELMHAFGINSHPADANPSTAANYVDTGTATWGLLTIPARPSARPRQRC